MDGIGGGGDSGISSFGGGGDTFRSPEPSSPVSEGTGVGSDSPGSGVPDAPAKIDETDKTTLSEDAGGKSEDKEGDNEHLKALTENLSEPGLTGPKTETPAGETPEAPQAPQGTPSAVAPGSSNGMVGAPVRDKDMWSTPNSEWQTHPNGLQTRTWSAGDQNGPWTEVRRLDGTTDRSRTYTENGQRWRYREGGFEGLRAEAERRGSTTIQVPGPNGQPMDLKISGGATPQEIQRVRDSVMAMPPQARINARDISLSNDLGQIYSRGMNQRPISGVGGMAGNPDGSMVIDRNSLTTPGSANYLIHHEAGHNLQARSGYDVTNPIWSANPNSVSDYGGNSRQEDFAEAHRYLMSNWDSYWNSGALLPGANPVANPAFTGFNSSPTSTKAMEIMRLYGWDPSFAR